jgi:hypothetical protein
MSRRNDSRDASDSKREPRPDAASADVLPSGYALSRPVGGTVAGDDDVFLCLGVSAELNTLLDELALVVSGTRSDVIRKAIMLLKIALEAKQAGQKIGIVGNDDCMITEIEGLL